MLTRKACKWCGSIWHSKNKCEKREIKPFQETYNRKRTNTPVSTQKPSERPSLAYKGSSARSQATGYADKYFSAYIRHRGGDGHQNTCYTCKVTLPIDELQCGHFMSRRFINTRWHELNCWPQCNDCNVVKGGNLKVYEQNLRADYGDDAVDALKLLARSASILTTEDIKKITEAHKGVVF